MLKLRDYPGGRPDAANESNVEYSPIYGYPMSVVWAADDTRGNPVKVSIGFPFIASARINAVLLEARAELEAAASAQHKPGDSEIVLFAHFGVAGRAA